MWYLSFLSFKHEIAVFMFERRPTCLCSSLLAIRTIPVSFVAPSLTSDPTAPFRRAQSFARFKGHFTDSMDGDQPTDTDLHRPEVQALSRRLPTAAARFDSRLSDVRFMEKVALGQVFSEYFGFPCQF
jgi:hypothetical protein